ncbi:MAG: hypothetical protein IJP18_06480 [Oscillospiraceae bacterium]|nr:hypothetical protein [Oscillospiraceae bacterium]MBQ9982196.1 hypothetical protein [Oscillospiraceae bacterium]
MNTRTAKLLLAILVLFMTLTVINVIIHLFENDYVTETAVAVSASHSISFKGVYVRDEEVLYYDGDGVVGYAVDDGGRLSIGETAAYIYADDKQIQLNERIEAIDSEIAILNKIQNPGTQEISQPAYLSSLIEQAYQDIMFGKEKKDFLALFDAKQEILIYMSTLQYVTDEIDSLSDKIAGLEAEKYELESKLEPPRDSIEVPYSAYFTSRVDGYEGYLDYNKSQELTSSQIKSISDTNETSDGRTPVGKLISGYKWYIVGVVEKTDWLSLGDTVDLYFPSSDNTLVAEIESIRDSDDGNEKIITLVCTDMSHDFVQHRVENVEIQGEEYKGIRISREAIQIRDMEQEVTENGVTSVQTVPVKGVYVKHGEKVDFKKIDPVFSADDYVVSKIVSDSEYVQLYDDTIVGGMSLR